ncbi:MAG: hypothetical protein MRERC_6c002 [Mycoplasmataceae bacterium RC_NB112A]|nr:MAG: hypothetical protein MRERC_13c002 [Mycoplasmataceae bacterium RC_NB112A]KLL01925.1 MAG: hypothetical protein MRERC_6c002 [Mycoplasmataceae bacterium RC_NB112A]
MKCTKTKLGETISISCGSKQRDGEMWFRSDQHENKYQTATKKFQKISDAYEILTKGGPDQPDNSDIDEDVIWLMKQKNQNAFDYNNVKMEEIED